MSLGRQKYKTKIEEGKKDVSVSCDDTPSYRNHLTAMSQQTTAELSCVYRSTKLVTITVGLHLHIFAPSLDRWEAAVLATVPGLGRGQEVQYIRPDVWIR